MFREGYIVLAQGIVVRPEIILGLMGLLTSTNLLRLILLPSTRVVLGPRITVIF